LEQDLLEIVGNPTALMHKKWQESEDCYAHYHEKCKKYLAKFNIWICISHHPTHISQMHKFYALA